MIFGHYYIVAARASPKSVSLWNNDSPLLAESRNIKTGQATMRGLRTREKSKVIVKGLSSSIFLFINFFFNLNHVK